MEYREVKCPKCQEIMQIPKERERIICMFCGHEFVTNLDDEKVTAEYSQAKNTLTEQFRGLFSDIEKKNKGFARGIYQENFEHFCAEKALALKSISQMCRLCGTMETAYDEIAEIIVSEAVAELEQQPTKMKRTSLQLSINMYMVTFVIPSILTMEEGKYMPLAEHICKKWKESFKDSAIKPADFEALNRGFKRKFCYVTTAVCESLNKGQDCDEIRLLKKYRDGYLSDQPDGAELIHQYYDIAPTIVKRINQSQDRDEVYERLWKDYISPCVQMIEHNENEACKEKYMEMVCKLQKEYMMENGRD